MTFPLRLGNAWPNTALYWPSQSSPFAASPRVSLRRVSPLPAWYFVLMLFICKGIPASPELLVKILNMLRIQGEVQREARGLGGHTPRAAPLVAAANANL